MSFTPQWYRCVGDRCDENGSQFEEYIDDEYWADAHLEIHGGYTEEVSGPSSNPDLNQPQTFAGRMQTRAVENGYLRRRSCLFHRDLGCHGCYVWWPRSADRQGLGELGDNNGRILRRLR